MGLFAHCYHIRDNLTMRPHRLDNANKLSIKSSDINEAYSPNSYCDCCVCNPVSQFVAGGANEGDVRQVWGGKFKLERSKGTQGGNCCHLLLPPRLFCKVPKITGTGDTNNVSIKDIGHTTFRHKSKT